MRISYMAEEDEGAIGAVWAMGAEGAEGAMALWGFRAKCGTGVDGWIPLRLLRLLEHLRC